MFLNNISEDHKLLCHIPGLVEGGIIIVAADLWLIWIFIIVVRAIHEATRCTAMEHIHINADPGPKNRIQLRSIITCWYTMMRSSPPIKPRGIPLWNIVGSLS